MHSYNKSKTEESLSQQIQRAALYKILRRRYDEKTVAEKLGVTIIDAEELLKLGEWPLRTAIRVAEALGLRIQIKFF